ncbi:MAG: hypothetical protein ACRDN9_19525 [Streptosporangiaceae bacterium]
MRTRLAHGGIAALFLAGVWAVAAPFVMPFQPRGAQWVLATRSDVLTGGVMVGLAILGVLLTVSGGVRELRARAREPDEGDEDDAASREGRVPPVRG